MRTVPLRSPGSYGREKEKKKEGKKTLRFDPKYLSPLETVLFL